MYLTAVYKLRANHHDRHRLAIAMGRWAHAIHQAMAWAKRDQEQLLRCLTLWTGKDGNARRLVVDGKALHGLVLGYCQRADLALHSSARMSLVVSVEELLKSWLGLYAAWVNGGRQGVKPAFPQLPPATPDEAEARWEAALALSGQVTTLADEDAWRAAVTRAAKGTLLPQYFGACQSGVTSQAHCGLLQRADGRLYALLTLFPQGDRHGEPVARARNRRDRGAVRNVRAAPEQEFAPTERARASVLVPLECGRGHDDGSHRGLFLKRGTPKSAELCYRDGEYWLHVAFELADPAPRALSGNVLALRRGVGMLLAGVVMSPAGTVLERFQVDGRDLARLITAIQARRDRLQERGKTTAGMRAAARVAEHHLYSAGRQVREIACRHGAEIVLLKDPEAGRAGRWLAWKHFHRLFEILVQLCAEAGLPAPRERKVYGRWATCLRCGWHPGLPVRQEGAGKEQCGGCGAERNPGYHLAELLAYDTLRLRDRAPGEPGPSLGDFIRTLHLEERPGV